MEKTWRLVHGFVFVLGLNYLNSARNSGQVTATLYKRSDLALQAAVDRILRTHGQVAWHDYAQKRLIIEVGMTGRPCGRKVKFASKGYFANPCKHIAATHYILGERFDEDPFLIFRLRGRTQEQVMAALRQRRAGEDDETETEEEVEAVIPLDKQLAHFWELSTSLDGFSVSIHPPAIELPLLKRLGKANFVPTPGLESLLRGAYQAISKKALEAAYRESDEK